VQQQNQYQRIAAGEIDEGTYRPELPVREQPARDQRRAPGPGERGPLRQAFFASRAGGEQQQHWQHQQQRQLHAALAPFLEAGHERDQAEDVNARCIGEELRELRDADAHHCHLGPETVAELVAER